MRLELDQNASAVAQFERSAVVGSNGSTTSHFDEVLSNGISAAQAGHRAQARILLQYAVEIDPKSEAGWLWLASISEYPEELLIFLDRVLEINAKNSRALEWKTATKQLLAKTFVQRGIDAANEERNQEAMSCFDTALSYDEQSQLAWFWKDSLSKQAAGEEPEVLAVEVGQEEAALEPVEFVPEPSKYEQAEAALASGDRQQALNFVNAAINEFPELENAWALRSHLVDDFDEKRRSLERVVEINPENATARAALETLLAMVETVAPNARTDREAETQLFSNSPFDSIAEHVPVVDEKMPTGELEFPDAFVQHNPFAESESYEMAGDVWESDPGMETNTDEPNRSEESFSADDYPTIIVPFDEDSEPLYVAGEHLYESAILPQTEFGVDGPTAYSEPAIETVSTPEVQAIPVSNYLEGSYDNSDYRFNSEANGSVWQDEPAYAVEPDAGHGDTWVVEDSDAYPVEEVVVDTAQTILVVDDSAVVRKLIAGKLEESGYNVLSAGSGVEALAVMSSSRPDLVLLDIAMPKMDGYQVCEKIRKNELTRDIPVVMISGKDGYFDEDRGQKAGTSSFISKPFGPETLMKALDTYLPSPAVH
ncbi:MAG: response regulator [Acidobacteriota bacterium]